MLQVLNPFNQSLIQELPFENNKNIEQKLSSAYDLFQTPSKWLPPYERISILEKIAALLIKNMEDIIKISTQEGGKPIIDTRVEVMRAVNGVKLAIEHIGQMKGEQIPMGLTKASTQRLAFSFREPIGVVAAISAFNHPINLIIHQTIPAIAVGCPVIIKPALTTPLTCLALIDLYREAGLPEAWCQTLIVENEGAEKLITDKRVNYFSFIGSAKIGWYLRSKLSAGTRCALEHGGAAPVIVEADADINELIPAIGKGGFYHAGQVCVSVQRIYVHHNIIQEVAEKLIHYVENLKIGNPMDVTTDVGPLILPQEVNRIHEWVQEALEGGAKLLCGGKKISETVYAPTILLNPPVEAKVSQFEIFGPVVCLYEYDNLEHAVQSANALEVHFQAAVFSKNIDVALSTAKQLNATAVMINDHTAFRVDWMPFAGRDISGLGIGGIQYSMHEMTRDKMIVIKSALL